MKSLNIRNRRSLSNAVSSICERLEARQLFAVTGSTFADEVPYGTETESAMCVATGDLNNDGKADIVAGTSGDGDANHVRVYLNNGDGTFAAGVSYATDGQPNKLRIADFNGDGVNDVLLINETFNTSANTNIRLYVNTGGGTLAAPAEIGNERYDDVEIGDFNGDNRPDIAGANSSDMKVYTLTNKGNGTFNDAEDFTTTNEPTAITVGDVNNDGKQDIVIGNRHDYQAMSYLGNGDGTFGAEILTQFSTDVMAIKPKPMLMQLMDLNGDGKRDMLSIDTTNGTLVRALGNGDGTFNVDTTYSFPSADGEMAFGDFDGDGRIDGAAGSGIGAAVKVVNGQPNGSFDSEDEVNFFVSAVPVSVATADFNGDGKLDLVSAQVGTFSNVDSRNIAVWINESAGSTPTPENPTPENPTPENPTPENPTPDVVDLTATVTGALPTSVVGGADGKVKVTVINNGDAKYSGPVKIELFASIDGAVDVGDALLTTFEKNVSLAVDKSKAFTLAFDYAAGVADGAYNIIAKISNVTGETVTDNNTASAAAPVTIAAPFVNFASNIVGTLPSAVVGGAKGKVKVNVANNGNVLFKDVATVQLFASQDDIVDGSDIAIATFTKKLTIKNGKASASTFNFNFPVAIEDGGYQLLAKVIGPAVQDTASNVAASVAPITIAKPFVNLESTLTAKPETKLGKKTAAALLLENFGNVPAKGDVTITVYASTDGQLAGTTQLTSLNKTINIAANKSKKLALSLDTSDVAAGTYTLIATVTWNGAPANTNTSDPASTVIAIA